MTMQKKHGAVFRSAMSKKQNRGFTLTEIAIVLGIIGLILGAIWSAAAAVYSNMRVATAQKQMLTIVQNVRSLYATANVTGSAGTAAAGVDMTLALVAAGVFPKEMLPAGTSTTLAQLQTPWGTVNGIGSTIRVYSTNVNGTNGDGFSVQYIGIPTSAAINLIVATTGSQRDPGLVGAGCAASAAGAVAFQAIDGAGNIANNNAMNSGLSAATVAGWCGATQAATMSLHFRLN